MDKEELVVKMESGREGRERERGKEKKDEMDKEDLVVERGKGRGRERREK